MKPYATREEAINSEVIAPLEARGAEHVRIHWDVDAIADEVLSGPEEGHALKVGAIDFWRSVGDHERRAYWTRKAWFYKDNWTGWTTQHKGRVLAYVLVVKEDVNEDAYYEDGDWAYGVEEMFYSTDPESGRKKFYLTGNWSEFDNLDSAEKYILKMVSR